MVRIHAIESLRFPGEGSSAQGKSGPKERPKGVSDGQQVEIPAPPIYLKDARDTGVEGKRGRGKTRIERGGGLYTRENAGISSESKVRNFAVESLRFPGEGSSSQGKSGPKPRPKGVGDGQQVDIPVPPTVV